MSFRTMNRAVCFSVLCLVLASQSTLAFTPANILSRPILNRAGSKLNAFAAQDDDNFFKQSFVLSNEDVNPLVTFNKGAKEKCVNNFGVWALMVSLITGPIWAMVMSFLNMLNQMNDDMDPNRAIYDGTGKVWSKVWLTMTDSYPVLSGEIDQIKEGNGPCLYVANHASWMDIPVICTVLDPVFKFISKAELKSVPCIGQQLSGVSFVNWSLE